MPIDSPTNLVETLRRSRLLEPNQLNELTPAALARFPDARSLARELLQRGWLTPYQINQLFQGKEADLVLGQYVVLERLGEGGMGQVFKARQQRMNRTVALKVIRKDKLANPEAVRRFHREIQAAAQLSHTNVVVAYDADQVNNTHFFAMEYVDGTDLMQMVKQSGPLPVQLAVNFIRQAALGLQHAFERGLVHRDIKPSNLLVAWGASRNVKAGAQAGATGQPVVKILDMGLARLDTPEGEDDTSALTQEGSVMGTLDYLAPEQAQNSRLADIRSDLYSLGCTFYYLLAAQPPFPGGTATEKLLKHRLDAVPPLSRVRNDVPAGVQAVIARLLAKKPEDRFQTPGELANALSVPYEKIGVGLPATPGAAGANGDRRHSITPAHSLATAPVAVLVTKSPGTPVASALPLTFTGDDTLTSGRLARMVARPWHRLGFRAKLAAGGAAGLFLLFILVMLLWAGGRKGGRRSPDPLPTPEATSEGDLRKVKERIDDYKGDPETLRRYLLGVRRAHPTTPLAVQAAELLTELPSTLDALDARNIAADDLAALGNPDGLVAVLGDQRMRHWGSNNTIKARAVAWSPDSRLIGSVGGDEPAIRLWDPATGKQARLIATNSPYPSLLFTQGGKGVGNVTNLGLKVWDTGTGKEMQAPAGRYLAATADGNQLATITGTANEIKIWNAATNQERSHFQGHNRQVWSGAFSADGQLFASGGEDVSISVWETATGKLRHTLRGPTSTVYTLRFAGDNKLLASHENSSMVRVFDIAAEKEIASFANQNSNTWGIAPDGKSVVIRGADGNGKLIDLPAAKERATLKIDASMNAVAYSPGGQSVAIGNIGGGESVRIFDVAAGTQRPSLKGAPGSLTGLAYSPDGRSLATCSHEGYLKTWDVFTGKELQPNVERPTSYTTCLLTKDGKTLALGSWHSFKLFDLPGLKERANLAGQGQLLSALISPDDQTLVMGSYDRHARFYDIQSGQLLATVQPGVYGVTAVSLSPDGKTVAATEWSAVKLYDIATGQPRGVLDGFKPGLQSAAFSPDGKTMAVGHTEGNIAISDLASKRVLRNGQVRGAATVAFTPDGRYLVGRGGQDGVIKVWDTTVAKDPITLPGGYAWAVAPDSRTIAVGGGQDAIIRVYDVATGQVTAALEGHSQRVDKIAYSLDGRQVASTGSDGRVIVWDPSSRKRKVREWHFPGPILDVAFAPDGRHLVSVNGNGTALILRIR